MKFEFWKHHEDDRWYWSFTGGTPINVKYGFSTLNECLDSLLAFRAASDWPEAGVVYRDKPGN